MPKFTIERSYDVPYFVQRTYEADTPEQAMQLALTDDNWIGHEPDFETHGPTRLTGMWKGEDTAYEGGAVPVPKTWTAFCQSVDGTGTIWIDKVSGKDHAEAIETARENCADDWEVDPEDVHVLGLASGDVTINYWDDLGD